jgi:2-polyprenyl-3-methyl-5-hydroxy-6-metoxy-1,4-benzoquinol methylase
MRPINRRFDAIIFSDVVEHLLDPQAGMEKLRQLLAPGGTIFFATATNAAFWDHTIIFENVDQIKRFIHNNGFKISHQIEITVFENPDGRKVVDYLAVLHADEN